MPSTKGQNRKDVNASRERDRKAGIVRVEVRIPVKRRAELLTLCANWRAQSNRANQAACRSISAARSCRPKYSV